MKASASLFAMLRTPAALGRVLVPEDDAGDGRRVAILTHGLWTRRFGVGPGHSRSALVLNGDAYTIVGVLPRGVHHARPRRRGRGALRDGHGSAPQAARLRFPARHRPAAPGRDDRAGARRPRRDHAAPARSSIRRPMPRTSGRRSSNGGAHWRRRSGRCCCCCRARWRWCCSPPAPTSPTCSSPRRSAASTSSPSAPRSAPRARGGSGQLSFEALIIAAAAGAGGILVQRGAAHAVGARAAGPSGLAPIRPLGPARPRVHADGGAAGDPALRP